MKPFFLFISSITIYKLFPLRHTIINWVSSLFIFNKALPKLNPNELFISKQTKLFLNSFQNNNTFNDNIESCFYDKKEFTKVLNTPLNTIETRWKTRFLFENTPYGNVIMGFSPYKMGFEYYSDSRSIPYSILNAVSMKFCCAFFCRDLFVDNSITPENNHSKLIPIHFLEDTKTTTEHTTTEHTTTGPKTTGPKTNLPFAKLKKKNILPEKVESNTDTSTISNRFIYLGKTNNFSILQKINTSKSSTSNNGFYSKLLDNVINESGLQTNVLDYKAFKKSMETGHGPRPTEGELFSKAERPKHNI